MSAEPRNTALVRALQDRWAFPPPAGRHCSAGEFSFNAPDYPGPRPAFSYALHKGRIHPIEFLDSGGPVVDGEELDSWLSNRAGFPLVARVGIAGYGSNLCPGRLREKGVDAQSPVVIIRSWLVGLAAAYCCGLSEAGYVAGALVRSGDAEFHGMTFLERGEQLELMDRSEGRKGGYYTMATLREGKVILEGGHVVDEPIAYVSGRRGVLCDSSGSPLLMRDCSQSEARKQERADRRRDSAALLSFSVIDGEPSTATKLRPVADVTIADA